jgi:glutamate racemase
VCTIHICSGCCNPGAGDGYTPAPMASHHRGGRSVRQAEGDPRPIGVFDSGVGGLTVARALMDLLPDERLVYLGDSARGPYGPRALDEVRGFAIEIVEALARDCKLVVAACNTATAAALDGAAIEAPVPLLGVIKPAVRTAGRATRSGVIGVIGTAGTVRSEAYDRAVAAADPGVDVVSVACPRFVDLVERGRTADPETRAVAAAYLEPLRAARVDTLILGCTHYPLLTGVLSYVLGPAGLLVSSAEETARRHPWSARPPPAPRTRGTPATGP